MFKINESRPLVHLQQAKYRVLMNVQEERQQLCKRLIVIDRDAIRISRIRLKPTQ